jgi:hypothetical protein
LTSKVLTGSVYWLATGNVTIAGTIDLSGENGHPSNITSAILRVPAAGGAGGYGGGVGGTPSIPAEPGNGPGGGAASITSGSGKRGTFTASQYLIPLVGGSGGGGGVQSATSPQSFGAGGGGGGGAILIASSTSITFTAPGGINANGGNGANGSCSPCGGGGSGGAIRMIAPTFTAQGYCTFSCPPETLGHITVSGGSAFNNGENGTDGLIRVEGFNNVANFISSIYYFGQNIVSQPFSPIVPATAPGALNVTSLVVGGTTIPINANPFSFPDAAINSSAPVTVNVQAQYIPTGTIPKIIVMFETGPDQAINCSAPLTGTLQQSTCSAQITFPTGGSRGFVKATW